MATFKIIIEMSDGKRGYCNFEAEDMAAAMRHMGTARVRDLTPTEGIDRVLSIKPTNESPTEGLVIESE